LASLPIPVTHFTCENDHEFAVRGEGQTAEVVLVRPPYRAQFVEMVEETGATTHRALFHLLDGQGNNRHAVAVGFTSAAVHASGFTPDVIERDLPLVAKEWIYHRLMTFDPTVRPELLDLPATAFWDIDSHSDFFNRVKERPARRSGFQATQGSPRNPLPEASANAETPRLWALGPSGT
jgi:hypothetical protein